MMISCTAKLVNNMIKRTDFVIFVFFLLILLVPVVCAADFEIFDVGVGDQDVFSLDLREGMSVEGSISITGGTEDDIDFWITDPVGNTVLDFGRVSQETKFEFDVDQNGAYNLHLDNSFSLLNSKNVVVTYEVFIAGLNQTQLLLLAFLVIAIIVIGIIIIFKKGTNSRTKCEAK